MNVTREIVKDLLPLYVSGEASSDSRALVESFLREDPELARLADALRAGELAPTPGISLPPGVGRTALDQTKRLLRRRTWLMALALFFTGLPLSFVFDETGLRFPLLRDAPVFSAVSWAAAVALWIAFRILARRLRVAGL